MVWLALVGIGSGMFMSPNTAAMMGTVPTERRGIAAGARTMLQNTGAVISIAFVLAIVTAAVPKPVLFKIFSGLASGLTSAQLDPFIAQHAHRPLGRSPRSRCSAPAVSLLRPSEAKRTGAASAALAVEEAIARRSRRRHERGATDERRRRARAADRRGRQAGRDHAADDPLLRGDRAAAGPRRREPGAHRTYAEADVERLPSCCG